MIKLSQKITSKITYLKYSSTLDLPAARPAFFPATMVYYLIGEQLDQLNFSFENALN